MANEPGKSLTVACRYVPYDQWFITHIDPTWKIKHLKQRIISKCLNLPFDPRFVQKDVTPNVRPPSPITFAPAAMKTGSSIDSSDTGGGDQESTGGGGIGDEGYEEDDEWEQDFSNNLKVKSRAPTTASTSFRLRLQQQQKHRHKQEQEPQITTHPYSLFRFSTGQILEEDYQISWYNIQPHELVELHSSFLPPTFALVSSMTIPSPPPYIAALPPTSPQKKKKSSSLTTTPPIPCVTALPRHIPNLYIQPYWHGWVRALWRIETVHASDGHPVEDNLKDRRHREKIEWSERWLVIHNGVMNICRNPTDQNPTRLPLLSFLALRGPEHLPRSIHTKKGTSKPPSSPSTISTMTAESLHTRLATSEDLAKKDQETAQNDDKQSNRNTKKTRKDGKQDPFSAASSPSLRSPAQNRQPHHLHSYPNPKSPSAEDREREREKRKALERDLEALRRWEDLSFPFNLGGKDKDKAKSKDKEKDKEREKRDTNRLLTLHQGTSRQQHHKEDSRSRSLRTKNRDKTFIPTSKEEAEQAGMKIFCIKFRAQPDAAEGDRQDAGFTRTRRYTSTGPSLASVATSAPGAEGAKMKTTGPHIVIDSDVYVAESLLEEFGGLHGRHQPQPQRQGILLGSNLTPGAAGTVSAASPTTGFTRDLFGGINEEIEDEDRNTTQKRKDAEDGRGRPLSSTGAVENWKYLPSPKLEKDMDTTEFGGEGDGERHATSIAGPSHMVALSLPVATRPTVVIPSLTPPTTTVSPESQPESQTPDNNRNSDSSSSISISSPVFAHSTNESDLDDKTYGFGGRGTASGMAHRPRKGYRYGGYHVQGQVKKAKSVDERLSGGRGRGVGNAVDVDVDAESKLGHGQQTKQEQERKDEQREEWIALDMVTDNAFSSILRILHRHSPPSLSSSFTPSHRVIDSPTSHQPNIPHNPKLSPVEDIHHGPKEQVAPSDTDDVGRYAATAKKPTKSNKAIHPPILESLAARTSANYATQPLYVALPYPEWRLELVNRARRAGLKEIGRPLDLALHGWGREFEEMAAAARERKLEKEQEIEREKKKKRMSASTIKRVSRVIGGSDADDDDDEDGDEEEDMGKTQLDSDSEEESDTEWLAWMADLARQFHVQQSQMAVASAFTNPFSSLDDGTPVRPPRTQEEERLLHADKMRQLEPSAISTVIHPPYLPSPTSPSFLPTLSSYSSFESISHQNGSSSDTLTPFPGFLSMDDLLVNRANSRAQTRSLQHLGSHRHVRSVPEEAVDPVASSPPSKPGLHHSVSVDHHLLASRKNEVDSYDSTASKNRTQDALNKPILTREQIMQIETGVFPSPPNSSLPSHWTFPPIPMPSPPPRPPSSTSYTPSASTSTGRPPVFPSSALASSGGVEVKAPSSISVINRLTSSDPQRSSSLGNSLSSPLVSVAISPNSTSPLRSSVFGSLGRSPSLLRGGQEKDKLGFFLRKKMSRDLGKDKEKDRDVGDASAKRRPELNVSSSTSPFYSMSSPHGHHPEVPSPTPSPSRLYHSPGAIGALLRRVRSGSSLRDEERVNTACCMTSSTSPAGLGAMSPGTEGKEVQKKKKGAIDRIVRGFDGSMSFAEGW